MESINEVIFAAVSLIFLLLGIVLLVSILFSAFNPYDQLAFANTEKLKASIEQACLTNMEVDIKSFELRQNTPTFTWLFTILPRWMIRLSGDPNYVLYYESFPPPEAVGWEVYHNFQNRLIVPIPANWNGKGAEDVNNYVKSVKEKYHEKNPGGVLDAVIINNIVLSEAFRSDYIFSTEPRRNIGIGEETEFGGSGGFAGGGASREFEGGFFSYGKWNNKDEKTKIPFAGNNQFIFTNYLGLTDIEKTSIKYQACGENALCLKTKSGVYRFPLPQCKDKGIKSIQLVYYGLDDENALSETGAAGAGAVLAAVGVALRSPRIIIPAAVLAISGGAEFVKRHIALKFGDFNAVSPCLIKDDDPSDNSEPDGVYIKVKYTSCREDITFQEDLVPVQYTPCQNIISYPLYQYDASDEKLHVIGDHYACVESVGSVFDEVNDDTTSRFQPSDRCVQLIVKKIRDDYCWTPNPYKKATGFWDQLLSDTIVRDSFMFIFNPPIRDNTAFIADASDIYGGSSAVVLLPTQAALQKGERFFEALGRKWWWGWP